jgi:hypothetical protein
MLVNSEPVLPNPHSSVLTINSMFLSEVPMLFNDSCSHSSVLYLLSIFLTHSCFSFGFQVLSKRHACELGVATFTSLAHHTYQVKMY